MGQINIRKKNDISEKFRRFLKKFRNFMRISRKKYRTVFAIFVSRTNPDQWSKITRIMVLQRNRWIRDQSGFVSSFDSPWSVWSWITDPGPNHPKGTHSWAPYLRITQGTLYQQERKWYAIWGSRTSKKVPKSSRKSLMIYRPPIE